MSHPYVTGSDTSYQAAQNVRTRAPSQKQRIFAEITRRGAHGATDDYLERYLKLSHQTVSARRRELFLAGQVQDSGRRSLTVHGEEATVWVVGDGRAVQASRRSRFADSTIHALAHYRTVLLEWERNPTPGLFQTVVAGLHHLESCLRHEPN